MLTISKGVCIGSLVLAGLGACGEGATEPNESLIDETETGRHFIFGGDPVAFQDGQCVVPAHCGVVGLHSVSRRGVGRTPFCSGTWIAPRVVLTAAHCVYDRKTKSRTRDPSTIRVYMNPDDAELTNDTTSAFLGRLVAVEQVSKHANYNPNTIDNDIALLRLATDVPAGSSRIVPPLPASLGFTSADVTNALPIDFAGYGITETYSGTGRLEAVNHHPLGALGCGTLAGCSGANPDHTIGYTQIGDAASKGYGPCSGDSGGPGFIQRDGTTYVAGITSYGDAACTLYGISARVDAYESYIAAF